MALREQSFLILLALTEVPLHGYGIIAAVRSLSDGRVSLGAGTLYGALDRLSERELVALDKEEVVNGRTRRYYRLTESGLAALAEETGRLTRLAEVARERLRQGPSLRAGGGVGADAGDGGAVRMDR